MGGTRGFAELLIESQAELGLSAEAFAALLGLEIETLANLKLRIVFPTFADRLAAVQRIEAAISRRYSTMTIRPAPLTFTHSSAGMTALCEPLALGTDVPADALH
jgi:hypothetical protein